LPRAQVDDVLDQCWRIGELADVGALARATTPRGARAPSSRAGN